MSQALRLGRLVSKRRSSRQPSTPNDAGWSPPCVGSMEVTLKFDAPNVFNDSTTIYR